MAAPSTLLLVRHGHTAGNGEGPDAPMSGWADLRLSELGRREARAVARRLARWAPGAAIHTSPLDRARATAGIIAAATGGSVRIWDGLKEIHCGEVEGMRIADVAARYPELWAANLRQEDAGFRWPGGESYGELRARCLATLGAIAAVDAGRQAVVVTHAGVIAQVIGWLRDAPAARWSCFRPENCSVTTVIWAGDRGAVLRFDDQAHLAEMKTRLNARAQRRRDAKNLRS